MISSARNVAAAKSLLRRGIWVGGSTRSPIYDGRSTRLPSTTTVVAHRSFVCRTGTQWMPVKTIDVSIVDLVE